MDFTKLLGLLPLIMQAVSLAKEIRDQHKSGSSVVSIVQNRGQDVVDLVSQAGSQLFPNLGQQQQIEAGVLRFDATLTKKIQSQLNKMGVTPALDVDGHYGPKTKAAVTEFQKKSGLAADGWAGPVTQAKLDEAVSAGQ